MSATLTRASTLELPGLTTAAAAISAARHAHASDRLWVVDTSQIWAGTCWLYFSFVLDTHSRRCRGWLPHRVPHSELVRGALEVAAQSRAEDSRETAVVFTNHCRDAGLDFPTWAIPSASDGALAQAFSVLLRRALLDREEWELVSHAEGRAAIETWIFDCYNPNVRPRRFVAASL